MVTAATAYFIEEEKFKSVDEAIDSIKLKKFEQRKLSELVSSQKSIRLSYGTLSAVIEIFKRANKIMLGDIKNFGVSKNVDERVEKTNLYLKNAILVYELTNFVIDYLSNFDLAGVSDLKNIQKQVLIDIHNGQCDDQKLKNDLKKSSSKSNVQGLLNQIEGRDKFRSLAIEKWDEMMRGVEKQISVANDSKGFILDLKLIRDNSKNSIDIINIAFTTNLVENSIEIISELASSMSEWELPAMDEQTARELLNLEIGL